MTFITGEDPAGCGAELLFAAPSGLPGNRRMAIGVYHSGIPRCGRGKNESSENAAHPRSALVERQKMKCMKNCLRFHAVAVLCLVAAGCPGLRAQGLPDLRTSTQIFRNFRTASLNGWQPGRFSAASSLRPPLCGDAALAAFASSKNSPERTELSLRISLNAAEQDSGPFPACGKRVSAGSWNPTDSDSASVPPVLNCSPAGGLGLGFACPSQPVFSLTVWSKASSASTANSILAVQPRRERFHWGPALWQSVEFLVLEHAWRLAWDPYARYLVFHKPFWHDYLASADHFEMNRWGDGDDFLVNYIGHPLEGSVSGNIFLQNDPQGRSARFGKSRAYWNSRLKALGWAAVYSAYFEIGPILSEAALGNEGGYTYIPGCGAYPTCHKEPGKHYKPPTNNTGWVDFVVTPTIGTGWILLEDAIETKFVDRIADGRPDLRYKILRGALSPSRTMSNFLAGKPPWYRYSPENSVWTAFGAPYQLQQARPEWMDDPRWNFGLQFISLGLPMDWEGCSACRVYVPGIGLSLDYRLSRFLTFDSEYNFFPGGGAAGKRGGAQEVLAGLKVGRPFRSWGVFSQVRPGFIHYDKALVPGSKSAFEGTTRFALDLGGSVEYYTSHRSAIRFNLGTTLVHYLTGSPDPRQMPVSVLSNDYYTTQGSFHVTSGYVFRF